MAGAWAGAASSESDCPTSASLSSSSNTFSLSAKINTEAQGKDSLVSQLLATSLDPKDPPVGHSRHLEVYPQLHTTNNPSFLVQSPHQMSFSACVASTSPRRYAYPSSTVKTTTHSGFPDDELSPVALRNQSSPGPTCSTTMTGWER